MIRSCDCARPTSLSFCTIGLLTLLSFVTNSDEFSCARSSCFFFVGGAGAIRWFMDHECMIDVRIERNFRSIVQVRLRQSNQLSILGINPFNYHISSTIIQNFYLTSSRIGSAHANSCNYKNAHET